MKALSLTQPWASLMACGEKFIETRSWATAFRGELAICASKGFPKDCRSLCIQGPFESALRRGGFNGNQVLSGALPVGVVLAVVEVYDCRRTDGAFVERGLFHGGLPFESAIVPSGRSEVVFGDYSRGRFGFLTRNLRRLREPVPVKGSLGLWTLPPDVEARVRAQLEC